MAIIKATTGTRGAYKHGQNYPSTSGNCPIINPVIVKTANSDPQKRKFSAIGGEWKNYDLRGLGELRQEYGLNNDVFALAIIDIQIHNLKCKQAVIKYLPLELKRNKEVLKELFVNLETVKKNKVKAKEEVLKSSNDDLGTKEKTVLASLASKIKENKQIYWIAGGIGALVIIGLLFYFLRKKKT